MRVVYITNDFLDECGGTARHVEELSRRVAASSDVTVLYLSLRGRSNDFIDEHGRRVICLPCPGSLASRMLRFPQRRVSEMIAAIRPDIVHLHSPLEAALLKRPRGPAFLYTLHSSVYARLSRYAWWRELVLRGLWKKFDCVIAPSAFVAQQTRHPRCVVIPNGVDLAQLDRERLSPEQRRQHWQVDYQLPIGDRTVLLSVARLAPVKGILSCLQQNAALLRREERSLVYVIAGDGPQRPAIEAYIKQQRLENVYLLGAVPHEQACELYGLADLCVIPSRFETFGITAIEAMAAGTPVAVTPVGALSELVEDHVTGFVLPLNADLSAVSSPTQQARWSTVGRHAQHVVATQYPWRTVAERTQALYAELCTPPLAVVPTS